MEEVVVRVEVGTVEVTGLDDVDTAPVLDGTVVVEGVSLRNRAPVLEDKAVVTELVTVGTIVVLG